MERAESVYGGTKSLYNAPCSVGYNQPAKSPGPPTQRSVGLNRSQSVYAKAPPGTMTSQNQSTTARQPALQSAQSTYLSARNVDLIRTESIYATRPAPQPVYGQQPRRPEMDQVNMMASPRESNGIYGATRAAAANQNSANVLQQPQSSHDRSKPESYQLEPIYGTRREMIVTSASVEPAQQQRGTPNPGESLYGRNNKVMLQRSNTKDIPM